MKIDSGFLTLGRDGCARDQLVDPVFEKRHTRLKVMAAMAATTPSASADTRPRFDSSRRSVDHRAV